MQKTGDQAGSSNSCSMVGFLGIIIQLALGALSFSILFIKRCREKPKRPWKIWFFDTSKQLISQIIAHFINLTISLTLAYEDSTSDECLWYFMTNILDNTIGVFICILSLKGIEFSLLRRNKLEYMSGNYYSRQAVTVQVDVTNTLNEQNEEKAQDEDTKGKQMQMQMAIVDGDKLSKMNDQPLLKFVAQDVLTSEKDSRVQALQVVGKQVNGQIEAKETQTIDKYNIHYKAWIVQLLIWISVVTIGKSIIFGFELGLQKPLNQFSFLILGWIKQYPKLELVFVMVMVPVIMNGFAFWIQDNFLKKKQEGVGEGELVEQTRKGQEQEQNRDQVSL